MVTKYGDITPRTAAYVSKDLLTRGIPLLVFEKFGQAKPIPANSTQSIKFRRYFLDQTFSNFGGKYNPDEVYKSSNYNPTVKVLTEGQTPNATSLKTEDVTATLTQVGDLITITDVILDTHEDPVLREATAIAGEQAAVMVEKMRFNQLIAGTHVFYANGSARSAVNTVISVDLIRKAVRSLKRNLAKPITSVIRSTAAYGTQNVNAGYVAIVHPDLEPDLRGLSGYVSAENYGSLSPWENELGKLEDVRFVATTICSPWAGSATVGGSYNGAGYSTLSTDGAHSDVYPVLIFARDAYGIVPLKGANAITPMVVNPKPSDSDPLGQRGHVGWKAWQTAVILNDAWMCRLEVASKAL